MISGTSRENARCIHSFFPFSLLSLLFLPPPLSPPALLAAAGREKNLGLGGQDDSLILPSVGLRRVINVNIFTETTRHSPGVGLCRVVNVNIFVETTRRWASLGCEGKYGHPNYPALTVTTWRSRTLGYGRDLLHSYYPALIKRRRVFHLGRFP